MNIEPVHIMTREHYERTRARESDSAKIAEAIIRYGTVPFLKGPDLTKEKKMSQQTNDDVRRQLGPTGKEKTR